MISSLWIAKTGLDAQQTNMDVIANNLANVSTNGFKRQRAVTVLPVTKLCAAAPGAKSAMIRAKIQRDGIIAPDRVGNAK